MSGPQDNDTLLSFLWGRLDSNESRSLSARLAHDGALCARLQEESAFEALFHSMNWESAAGAAGSRFDREFGAAAMLPEALVPGFSNVDELFSPSEWETQIDTAFGAVSGDAAPGKPRARMFRFPLVARYLAAACLIAAVSLPVYVYFARQNPAEVIVVSHRGAGTAATMAPDTGKTVVNTASMVFDSVIIFPARDGGRSEGKRLFTEKKDGIVRLGQKTGVLLDTNSSVAVLVQSDSAIALSLDKGSALFTVEKRRYRSFSVATPSCDIAVTGTVFRLAIAGDTTIVSVLEGSVLARRKNDTAAIAVLAGTSARIRPDTVNVEPGDTAATLLYRSNLLRDFIRENGVWENGRFVRSGIGPAKE